MSSIKNVIDSFTGGKQAASAARNAANVQVASGDKAIDFQKESRDIARKDLQPFREAGQNALSGLSSLISDPNAQLNFIQDNPFFQKLANEATQTLLGNQAAKGKVGSGGTAEALQNSLVLLGNDLLNQNIGQRQNLANLGANAASGQATITQNTANSVADTIIGQGNARAAGIVGARNAINEGRQGLLNLGVQGGGTAAGLIAACDIKLKENIKEVGKLNNGLPIYLFNYKGDNQKYINVMAQDVEKVKPHAVIEYNNTKFVNMEEACL